MWKFWQKPAAAPLSEKVQRHLVKERGLSDEAAASLRMMEQHGRYSGRKVTYFRVFDPAAVQAAGVDLRRFGDLDTGREVLHSGHVESDGQIVLSWQQADPRGNIS